MPAIVGEAISKDSQIRDLADNILTRERLLAFMRGTNINIQDLQRLTRHWPQRVHPEVARLEEDANRTLEAIFTSPKDKDRLRKMKQSRIALLAASWWAYALLKQCALQHICRSGSLPGTTKPIPSNTPPWSMILRRHLLFEKRPFYTQRDAYRATRSSHIRRHWQTLS
ncbi:hypothetical protein F5B20DRAFT_553924, partial [Whalleya microplaca]